MNELALFAGAGGGLLGTHLLGWRPICAVEIEPYRREVLLRRQRDGVLPLFPIWDDARTFDGKPWRGIVDVVTAGFPCQPFSLAGRRKGKEDERNLWPETIRILREVQPRFAFLENVPSIRLPKAGPGKFPDRSYFGSVLGDLAESGFDAEWDCVPASSVGANHRRDRLWISAYAVGSECGTGSQPAKREAGADVIGCGSATNVADSDQAGCQNFPGCQEVAECSWRRATCNGCWWHTEPALGRVADGLAHRVDRLKAIGDGQVPAVVRRAWNELSTKE